MTTKRISIVSIVTLLLFVGISPAADNPNNSQRGLEVSFLPFEHNPVLGPGPAGAWDDGIVFAAQVVYKDGLFHLFYNGRRSNTAAAIGYASSPDAFTFTKSDLSPILAGSGSGFDAFAANTGTPLLEGDTWVLYYSGRPQPGAGPGAAIGRATADTPTGPWTRDPNPVLTVGGPNEWDSGWIAPSAVIKTDTGYVMYYTAGIQFGVPPQMIGMATSPDGINWTKYHKPYSTQPPYAESNPVFMPGPAGSWDSRSVSFPSVRQTAKGWEMFYTGVNDIPTCCDHEVGYARSHDGIDWRRYSGNPVISLAMDPLGKSSRYVEVPAVVVRGSVFFMYYDYGTGFYAPISGFGVALGSIGRDLEF